MTEEKTRELANQFGFTGPLYIQKIPPEFAPPEGEEGPPVYTTFDRQRLLNLSNTSLNFEDRGVVIDYTQQLTFEERAPIVEAQLKAWNLLDFPYQLHKLPTGDLAIYRLIDGIPTQQNEFNITLDPSGRVGYFDYHPLRLVDFWGSYLLQSTEMAWQQLQTAEGRAQVRYQLSSPVESTPLPEFVTARSWAPLSEHGQERHLYMTPIDGALLVPTPWGQRRLIEVSSLFFRQVDDQFSIVFHEDDEGRIIHMFMDLVSMYVFEKLNWCESTSLNMALVLSCVLIFLSTIVAVSIRFIRKWRLNGDQNLKIRGARVAY